MATALPRVSRPVGRALRSAARVAFAGGRRLRLDRVLLAAALLASIAVALVEAPLGTGLYGIPVLVSFALAVVHAGSIVLAVRRPNLAAPVSLAAALVLQLLSVDTAAVWPWWPVLIVTQTLVLAAVAATTTLPVALLHWVIALGASAALAAALRPVDDGAVAIDLVVFGGVSVVGIVVALLATQWRRIRTELLHERQVAAAESERRVLMEERTRIARELHDVVAHGLSIIAVQSATARFRYPGFGEAAAAEFDQIGAQSRQALDEMRSLLRVLRGSEEDPDRAPQPGLADLGGLVASAAATGTAIALEEPEGDWVAGVAPLTGLAAYRIAQEATSNALRHAPGSAIRIVLERTPDLVRVIALNTRGGGAARSSDDGGGGHGLVGMAERAASVGGSVRFGPTDDGGYAVRAELPVHVTTAES